MLSSNGTITVVDGSDPGRSVINVYKTKLEMVVDSLSSGSLPDRQGHWGSVEHKDALVQVIRAAESMLVRIAAEPEEDLEPVEP